MASPFEERLQQDLERLEVEGRLRQPDDGRLRALAQAGAVSMGVPFVDASSNDYLGLARGGVSRETSVQRLWATPGAGASRLVHGTHEAHVDLERELADWVELPTALLFTSGYAANVGVLSALAGPGSLIVSDELNHASIIDGCRLSRAEVTIVRHVDVDAVGRALRQRQAGAPCVVITESCFSMDGDSPDLKRLRSLCDEAGAFLVVDEAHSLGVFGPQGRGRCQLARVTPDVLVGTLGKAVGVQGGFVAGSDRLRTVLWNRARSLVFSTAPSPLLMDVGLFHVQRVREADSLRARLHDLSNRLRRLLASRGLPDVPDSHGPIVPVILGDNGHVLRVAERMARHGILTQAIRPPTVPEGTARLRLTVTAAWPDNGPERVSGALAAALKDL